MPIMAVVKHSCEVAHRPRAVQKLAIQCREALELVREDLGNPMAATMEMMEYTTGVKVPMLWCGLPVFTLSWFVPNVDFSRLLTYLGEPC